ncbi:hypothetical protein B0H12DRAFT_297082 [Mycena haematopus]|nr:hypothetical protein B0H12DRAFT_297082 [Mycena haematopus]
MTAFTSPRAAPYPVGQLLRPSRSTVGSTAAPDAGGITSPGSTSDAVPRKSREKDVIVQCDVAARRSALFLPSLCPLLSASRVNVTLLASVVELRSGVGRGRWGAGARAEEMVVRGRSTGPVPAAALLPLGILQRRPASAVARVDPPFTD